MQRAAHLASLVKLDALLFEATDEQHGLVHV
jgi:hypothetical protein